MFAVFYKYTRSECSDLPIIAVSPTVHHRIAAIDCDDRLAHKTTSVDMFYEC